jgi:hypothetical protein
MPETLRVKTWQEFKEIAYAKNAKCVIYVIASSVPAKNHTGLRLILPVEGIQYIFIDTAKGDVLRRTGIRTHANAKGERFLTDEDVKRFLRTELPITDLQILSFWTA